MYIDRRHDTEALLRLIEQFPITLLTGPRQCGKTSLAKSIEPSRYFSLSAPDAAVEFLKLCESRPKTEGVICVDEIQQHPDVLPLLRQWVDTRSETKMLLLGSSAFTLIGSSSRHLLGRMARYELGGLTMADVGAENMMRLWSRGGFPQSYLAPNEEQSFLWRQEYITSYPHAVLERETAGVSPHLLRPLISALSQYSGGIINFANIARDVEVSRATAQRYLHLLASSGLIRLVDPLVKSAGAALRKNPKLYMRDSGLLACLAGLETQKQLEDDENAPAIWETFVIESLASALQRRRAELRFWRDRTGAEIDAVWHEQDRLVGAEIKFSPRPRLTKPMRTAIQVLQLSHLWVLHRGERTFPLADGITATPFTHFAALSGAPSAVPPSSPRTTASRGPSKRVFVSYCHADESFVQKLVTALESAAVNVTVDYKTLRLGGSINEFIKKAVRGTEWTIIVVSDKSLRSPWVMAEFLETVLYEQFTDSGRLIPIHLDKAVFDPDLPIEIDNELETKIGEVDDRIRKALDRRMDLEPFVGVRDRLRNLQFNVGKAVQRLTSVLSGDFSDPNQFQQGLNEVIGALNSGNQ